MNQLLKNIRTLRKQKGISQEAISEILGIDYSTFGKIERGQIELTVSRAEKIADILEVSFVELYTWEAEIIKNQSKIDEHEERINYLEKSLRNLELLK